MNTYQTEYRIEYKTVKINGLDIFYRETGPKNSPTILLLHGFPTSSHMFRNLIQKLSDEFHLVAPDYPGYGNSSMPSVDEFDYTFENMTNIIYKFTETIGLEKYSLYMMDYGAPIGFRLFSMQPEKVQAFIIQNGNAYDEGLGEFWNPIKDWWNNKTLENEKKLHYLVTEEATKWQYTNGTRNSQLISPDNWVIDQASLNRPGNAAIQLAMLYDYKTNPSLYSQWQENFRKYQPPTLIVWGKNDYIFPESGAHPYKRDLKDIETYILDTGHFALEEDCDLIANKISSFFSSRPEIKADKKENTILVTSELDNNKPSDNISDDNSNNSNTQKSIPETAKGPAIPSKGYLVEEIRDGLYWVTDGAYQTIFLLTDKGVVAVDAPPSIGKNYLKAISEVTDKPITHVIYSHGHIDHIGAASIFPKNAVYIAQENTAVELQRAKSLATNSSMVPPIPSVTFSNNYNLEIGNQVLKLDYHGPNHYDGNIFIYAPKQKVLMLVDVIFPGWVPFPYLAVSKDIAGYIKAHDIVLENYEFDTFVGGHLTRLGTVEDVKIQKDFISDLQNVAAKANNEILLSDIAKQVGGFKNPWAVFAKYNDAVDERIAQEISPKWEDKLGGVRDVIKSHGFAMSEAGRIDPTAQVLLHDSTFIYR